jgi:hypothetical protein
VLGFVYETVQERTGQVIPTAFVDALGELRAELDLPLIAVETTTAMYRSGTGLPFVSTMAGFRPDVLAWWGGGQTGYLHTHARWFIGTPLTLVSTWDGDELSLLRHHHQLRAARHLDIASHAKALDEALHGLRGVTAHGLGAYRVLDAPADLVETFAHHGIAVRRFPNGKIGIIPALDQIEAAAAAIREAT